MAASALFAPSTKASSARRVLLYLYSTPNIAGAALALVGLVPHLALELFSARGGFGLWYVIVPGLYGIGYLISWLLQSPEVELRIRHQHTAAEIRQALEAMLRTLRKRVSPDIIAKVESIQASILDVLPQIVETSGNYDLFTVRRTALDYLPEVLEDYLKLPPTFARVHPLREGKTAKDLLLEQLSLIDNTLKDVVINIHQNDANKLLVNQRFLEERLAENEFSV